MTTMPDVSYTHLRKGGEIVRQVHVGDGVIFDVDWTGCPVGVETIGDADWPTALIRLAMAGEVRLVHSIGQ